MKRPLDTVLLMLAYSNTFLIHADTVELIISLKGLLKLNNNCIFPYHFLSKISNYLLRVLTTHNSSYLL